MSFFVSLLRSVRQNGLGMQIIGFFTKSIINELSVIDMISQYDRRM